MAKRSLLSLFDEEDSRQIIRIQKEPYKIVNPVDELPPAIDMQQVVANVQTQEQREQAGMSQQQVEPLLHPNEEDTPLPPQTQMQVEGQQECQIVTPIVYIHQPIDASNNNIYDLTTQEGIQKYVDFARQHSYDINKMLQMTSKSTIEGSGFRIQYGDCTTDMNGTNLNICNIEFMPRKLIQLGENESQDIIERFVVKESRNIFDETRIGEEELEVFYNKDSLLGKEYSTRELLNYFKKIFILLSIDKELEFFIGQRHQPGYTRRSNFAHPQLWWSERIVSKDSMFMLSNIRKYDYCNTIYTHTVNISNLTTNMEINGKRVYFQVICSKQDVFIITNMFYETNEKKPLIPKLGDEPFNFDYISKLQPKNLNEWLEEEPDYYEVSEKAMTSALYQTYTAEVTRSGKRGKSTKTQLENCWRTIDLKFQFIYPTALLEYVPKPNSDEGVVMPAYFQGNHDLLTFDPKIILTNDWQILHSFIMTVLFPEQYIWPKPIGVDKTVDEQYIDQPAEPQAIQPTYQPFGQLAEHATTDRDIEARVDDVFEHPLIEQLREQQDEEVPDAVANVQMAIIQSNYEEACKKKEKEGDFLLEKDYGFLHPFSSQ